MGQSEVFDPRLTASRWFSEIDIRQRADAVKEQFGTDLSVDRDFGAHSIFVDRFSLKWVLAPAQESLFGMSDREIAAVKRLRDEPSLSIREMQPARVLSCGPLLCLQSPIERSRIASVGLTPSDEIGPDNFGLWDRDQAVAIASSFAAHLPTEREWEHICRAGTNTLFWFGDDLPQDDNLQRILGLEKPYALNAFGVACLFFGEWCDDHWSPDHESAAIPSMGFVIKGGSAQFWPWQEESEWAGCASAYRMPSIDMGAHGMAAVRLVRRGSDGN